MGRFLKSLSFAFLTFALAAEAQAKVNENIFSMQKRSLHEFAVKAGKAKDLKQLLDQSRLHWEVGFSKMREAGKNRALPKILTTKDGIELVSEGRKVSISATGKLFSFLLNGREFIVNTPFDLMATAESIEKFLNTKTSASFIFFQQAYAQTSPSPMSLAIGAGLGLSIAGYLTSTFFPENEKAEVWCEYDGSFIVLGDKTSRNGKQEELINYKPNGKEFRLSGIETTLENFFNDLEKDLKARGDKNVKESLEKAKAEINTKLQYATTRCKGKRGFTGDWGGELEETLTKHTGKPLRSDSSR